VNGVVTISGDAPTGISRTAWTVDVSEKTRQMLFDPASPVLVTPARQAIASLDPFDS